jgi:CMP-N,N'-diacetyllegionaminic acid synthase
VPWGDELFLFIVPARGGSKRLPGKHLLTLGGRPLIEWTAQSIQQSGLSVECLMTTDDVAIAAVGQKLGWLVPFLRPAELALDSSPTVDAVIHALDWHRENRGVDPEIVILLQVTSPLRSGGDIRGAVSLLQENGDAQAVVTMTESKSGRHGRWSVGCDGFILQTERHHPCQSLEPNGAVYAIRSSVLRDERSFFPSRTMAYVMPFERSVDIDTVDDLQLAETLLRAGP